METQNKVVTGVLAVMVAAAVGFGVYNWPEEKEEYPNLVPDKVQQVPKKDMKDDAVVLVPGKTYEGTGVPKKDMKGDPIPYEVPEVAEAPDVKPAEPIAVPGKQPYLVPGETPVAEPKPMAEVPMATPNRVPEPMEKNEAVPKKDMKGDPIATPADVKKGKTPTLFPGTIEQYDPKKVEQKGKSIIQEDLERLEADVAKLKADEAK